MTLVLRMIRTLRRESIEDVAEKAGLHRVQLQSIETNRVVPSPEVKDRLADYFGIPYPILSRPITDELVDDTITFIAGKTKLLASI